MINKILSNTITINKLEKEKIYEKGNENNGWK